MAVSSSTSNRRNSMRFEERFQVSATEPHKAAPSGAKFYERDSPLVLPEVESPGVNANQFRRLALVKQPVAMCVLHGYPYLPFRVFTQKNQGHNYKSLSVYFRPISLTNLW